MPKPGTALKAQNEWCASLGQRFRDAREARGISLRDLADGMKVAVYLIRRHEAGALMLRLDKLHDAAACLGVEIEELVKKEA